MENPSGASFRRCHSDVLFQNFGHVPEVFQNFLRLLERFKPRNGAAYSKVFQMFQFFSSNKY